MDRPIIAPGADTQHDLSPRIPARAYQSYQAEMEDIEGYISDGSSYTQDSEEGEEEADLDIYGRKHVYRSNDADGIYLAHNDSLSHFTRFTPQGTESAQVMRDYLEMLVPSHFVCDEYNVFRSLSCITSSHIARLQAKIWRDCPQATARLPSTTIGKDRISQHDVITAHTISRIAGTLEANYVFILLDNSNAPCHYALCQEVHKRFGIAQQPHRIALEPLVDWATLDVVADVDLFYHWILTYRRNKKLRFEFGLDISRFIPCQPVTFCTECLQFLWNNRVATWFIVDRCPQLFVFRPNMSQRDQVAEEDRPNGNGKDNAASMANNDPWEAKSSNKPHFKASNKVAMPSLHQSQKRETPSALPQLDGPGDPKQSHSALFQVWRDPVTSEAGEACVDTMHKCSSPPGTIDFTPSLFLNNAYYNTIIKSRGWATTNSPVTPITTQYRQMNTHFAGEEDLLQLLHNNRDPTAGRPCRGTFDMSEEEKYPKARTGFPTGPLQQYEHKAGITFPAPPMRDAGPISSGQLTPKIVSQAGYRLAVPSMLLGEAARVGHSPQKREFGRERNGSALTSRLPLFERPSTPIQEPPLNFDVRIERTPELRLGPKLVVHDTPSNFTPVNFGLNMIRPSSGSMLSPLMRVPSLSPEPPTPEKRPSTPKSPKKTGKHGPSLDPVGAQPWPIQKPFSESSLSPPEKRVPSAQELICACHKPAETYKVKIVECWNPECTIGWYHYSCLDKCSKLSSRYGKWMCDVCKTARTFARGNRGTTHFKPAFSAEEIVNGMRGPGGVVYSMNPYGLQQNAYWRYSQNVEEQFNQADDELESCDGWDTSTSDTPSVAENMRQTPEKSVTHQHEVHRIIQGSSDTAESALNTTNAFGYASSTPYWLTRAYSRDPSRFTEEFIDQYYDEQGYYDESYDGYYDEDLSSSYDSDY